MRDESSCDASYRTLTADSKSNAIRSNPASTRSRSNAIMSSTTAVFHWGMSQLKRAVGSHRLGRLYRVRKISGVYTWHTAKSTATSGDYRDLIRATLESLSSAREF